MKEALIFVGVQGAGKSAFYRRRFFDTHVRINLHMLRTRRRERLLFEACLDAGQSFAVDNTIPTPAGRARYIVPARDRRRRGAKNIPPVALIGASRKLQPPAIAGGFHRIFAVKVFEPNEFVVTPRF